MAPIGTSPRAKYKRFRMSLLTSVALSLGQLGARLLELTALLDFSDKECRYPRHE